MLKTSRDIQDRIDELTEGIKVITNLSEQENRDLTDEEMITLDPMIDELGNNGEDGKERSGLHARLDKRMKIENALKTTKRAPVSQPENNDPLDRRLRVAPVAARTNLAFRGEKNGAPAHERMYRFGHWCGYQLAKQMPHRFAATFEKSIEFAKKNINMTGTTTTHAAIVPEEFTADLIDLREQYGVARRVMRVVPMAEETRNDPRQTGRLTAYWTAESAPHTESDQVYDNVQLQAEKLSALTRITAELNQDSIIDIGSQIARDIAWSFAYEEDQAGFYGDGTAGSGGITGLDTALKTLTPGTAPGLRLIGGTTWGDITKQDILGMVGALPVYAEVEGEAVFICSKVFFYEVMVDLVLGQGGSTGMEMVNAQTPRLLGYPVVFSQIFPKAAAVSQIPVMFGNFNLSSRFGDRLSPEIMFSEHATIGGENVFERDQIAVKGRERLDIVNHDFGSDSEAGPVVAMITAAS